MAATVDDLALQVATLTSQIANLLSAVNVQKSYIDMASQIAVSGITGSSGSAAPAPGKSPIGAPNGLFSYAWLDPASNVVLAANCAGTANAITATFSPAIIALPNGLTVEVRAASANTTATPTFQANASAAKTIVKGSGVALVAGDISGAGHWLTLTYDSTLDKWVLGNPAMGLGVAAKGANADITSLSGLASINGGQLAGLRNKLLNSAFKVWQRGATGVGATSGAIGAGMAADSWQTVRGGLAAGLTWSRQVTGEAGAQYCLRVQRDSGNAATATMNLAHQLETVDSIPLQGKWVIFSFRARSGANFSAASSALLSTIATGTGTDQNNIIAGFTNQVAQLQTNTLTAAWQTFTHAVLLAANETQVSVAFAYTPVGTAGENDYFEVEWAQLEQTDSVTPKATPLEQLTYAVDLWLCQRRYEKGSAWMIGYAAVGGWVGSIIGYCNVKRTAANPVLSNQVEVGNTTLPIASGSINNIRMYQTVTATGNAYWSGTFAVSADL